MFLRRHIAALLPYPFKIPLAPAVDSQLLLLFLLETRIPFNPCFRHINRFFLARLIHQSPAGTGKRKAYLLLSLILNIGGLLLFKYLNFFSESFVSLLSSFNIALQLPTFQLLQPVGISYYTFKKISYIVDIYREQQEPSRHLGKFALYLSFSHNWLPVPSIGPGTCCLNLTALPGSISPGCSMGSNCLCGGYSKKSSLPTGSP